MTLVVIFPRQSGKNELQAQLECYLLACLHTKESEMIKISPTYQPQTVNAMQRLERVLERNAVIQQTGWKKENGYTYRVGKARMIFLSGSPRRQHRRARRLRPCWKWTRPRTWILRSLTKKLVQWLRPRMHKRLLGHGLDQPDPAGARVQGGAGGEQQDGIRRVWRLTAEDVGAEVAAYQKFVAAQVAKLGRNHPLIKTQFYSEDIDAEGGMFPPARRAMMQGEHSPPFLRRRKAVCGAGGRGRRR